MRKELYRLLCSELKAIDLIKHIDLWNHNVEFIEQEENWERPAVFGGILPYTVECDCSRCGIPGRTFDQAAHRDRLGRFEC